jgi:uncharacterized membrane protein
MEKMLVVIFDDELKAYEGSHALKELDTEGSIAIHAEAVIKKNADGTVTVKQSENGFPIRTTGGTAIGSLIGLFEGPIGVAAGAITGFLVGSLGDLSASGVDAEFVDDAAAKLTPGKCAVIADISEEWVTPVDSRMEALGGTIFRAARSNVADDLRARDVAMLRAEIDQLKVEQARARADHRAKLQTKIDTLNAKLQAKLDQAKQRSEQIKAETEAKVKAMQQKAEKTQGDMKAKIEGRVQQMRQERQESEAKLKHLLAGQLKEAAARLER